MPTEDDIEAILTAKLMPVAATLGAETIEREVVQQPRCGCLEMRGSDLRFTFHFAARLNEIEPSVAILTPAGPERLSSGTVQQWLGEPVQAYMFDADSLASACQRVADFAHRVIVRYRQDPAAAKREMDAIDAAQTSAYQVSEIRAQAQAAWAERDFAEAKRLYGDIEEQLTAAEGKRLAVARKRQP